MVRNTMVCGSILPAIASHGLLSAIAIHSRERLNLSSVPMEYGVIRNIKSMSKPGIIVVLRYTL